MTWTPSSQAVHIPKRLWWGTQTVGKQLWWVPLPSRFKSNDRHKQLRLSVRSWLCCRFCSSAMAVWWGSFQPGDSLVLREFLVKQTAVWVYILCLFKKVFAFDVVDTYNITLLGAYHHASINTEFGIALSLLWTLIKLFSFVKEKVQDDHEERWWHVLVLNKNKLSIIYLALRTQIL